MSQCFRCKLLAAKSRLGANGDWLFVTMERSCSKCAPEPDGRNPVDLDCEYSTLSGAEAAFSLVASEKAVDLLLEHSKEYYDGVLAAQDLQRDKAKTLLGCTTFTMAVLSFSATLMKDFLGELPNLAFLVVLLLFGVVMGHFVRGLKVAIEATMLEKVVAVSTQEIVELGAIEKKFFDPVVARRALAARYRAAATQTNQYLTEVKSQIVLAQACFKWGFYVLPVFVVASLLVAYSMSRTLVSTRDIGSMPDDVVSRMEAADVLNRLSDLENSFEGSLSMSQALREEVSSVRADLMGLMMVVSSSGSLAEAAFDRADMRDDEMDRIMAMLWERVVSLEKRVDEQRARSTKSKGGRK